ncbi:hypothetical protein [Corynebacterium efficiens YS-314]|uniref:Uncharacterized protein n=1 Tax=Corynebacterium efficiens (strain DSM 44549 / YS-314 / AJ 12310 / JCM 11189 / NBRC 100395) TaxID=196164 RepID=Q8FLR6_COREF|nr:hypothetical protein [Corynebacterium efficiens YS-314]
MWVTGGLCRLIPVSATDNAPPSEALESAAVGQQVLTPTNTTTSTEKQRFDFDDHGE